MDLHPYRCPTAENGNPSCEHRGTLPFILLRKILGEYGDRITFSVGYKTGFSISNMMLMQSRGGGIARRFRANFDVPG
jgi:hypothetical protein